MCNSVFIVYIRISADYSWFIVGESTVILSEISFTCYILKLSYTLKK